jgi:putative flippase GtrA
VALARALYLRFRELIHEFAKFGVVGVIGLAITNGGYDLLHHHVGMGPVTSTTVATVVATAVAYVGNRYWSFRHRERSTVLRESVIFFVLNGIGLLIQDAAVAANYYLLGLGSNRVAEFAALNFGIAVATLFRFWSYRRFVWQAPEQQAPSPAGPPVAAGAVPAGDQPAGTVPAGTAQPGGAVPASNGHPSRDRAGRAAAPGEAARTPAPR